MTGLLSPTKVWGGATYFDEMRTDPNANPAVPAVAKATITLGDDLSPGGRTVVVRNPSHARTVWVRAVVSGAPLVPAADDSFLSIHGEP
jgi:hypothetical protein